MSLRPWMTREARLELRARIDARVREIVRDELPPQGEHGLVTSYRKGCRRTPCRAALARQRRTYRWKNIEQERATWRTNGQSRRERERALSAGSAEA